MPAPGTMCCHKLYIYTVCGHSHFSQHPTIECRHASISPSSSSSDTCGSVAHPYQSWKLESLCPACERRRTNLMAELEQQQTVRYDEWKWKVSYGMPSHGKDYWGRKADEREEEAKSLREKEKGADKDKGGKSNRFSLKRLSSRKSAKAMASSR
ncbi:hypothetical protein LTR95_003957 [Oleoguttula sp. CCFEE 5521]